MELINIKRKEKELFNEWKESLEDDFCINGGLLFRGSFSLHEPYNGSCKWKREEGNEEELWKTSNRRIMILTKDLNDSDGGWDIRQENCGRKDVPESMMMENKVNYKDISFYRKLKRWIYALSVSSNETDIPSFEFVKSHSSELAHFYEEAPLVRINCKNTIGSNTVSNTKLKYYINRDSNFLTKQIKLYQANIIICCGHQNGENTILNSLVRKAYPDINLVDKTGEWIYHSEQSNVLVIDSYHPTATNNGDKWQYEELVLNFFKAVKLKGFKFSSLYNHL